MILCVGVVVVRDNKVLFVRQTYGGLKGQWSLPWGFVDDHNSEGVSETPEAAAVRETREEAGVVAEVEGLLGVQNNVHGDEAALYLLFLCRHIAGEPTPDFNETDKAAYFSLEEMSSFDEPFDKFCAWIAERVLRGEHHYIAPTVANPYHPYVAFL